MPSQRSRKPAPTNKWTKLLVLLVFVFIANYYYWNWGLITVKVKDAPLSKVIKSIEWQGWVTIYSNLPKDTKVTMYVDHVSLAEAMETLAVNVVLPPPTDAERAERADRANRPDRTNQAPGVATGGPRGPGGLAGGGPGGTPPAGGPRTPGGADGNPRGDRGGGGNFGGRGGFGGAQWNLAFFVAPTSSQVKSEIHTFESGSTDEDLKVYSYPTPLQMLAGENDIPASDPRLQAWSGYKLPPIPDSAAAPPSAAPGAATPAADSPPAPVVNSAPSPPTVHTYLRAFAESANIWIMAPGSWAPDVASPPLPNSSIIRAVKNFVGSSHGYVTQAIVLRIGSGGARGGGPGGPGGGGGDPDAILDRMRNAINGLPAEDRADALAQLDQEVKFQQDMKTVPQDQRRALMFQHRMEQMVNGNQMARMTPEKRAQRFQRLVAARQAAKSGATPPTGAPAKPSK